MTSAGLLSQTALAQSVQITKPSRLGAGATVGLVTPPMGMILFVASGLTRTGIEVISRELWPYLAVHFLVIVLISMIPALTLTIPKLFGFL